MEWQDGKRRCPWANPKNELYVAYHDKEWGVPVHDDHKLFEMLVLECFQAGLSWECVLNKREAFRKAFDGFDLDKISAYNEAKVESLMKDAGIIRNRAKIEATINNAQIFAFIQKEFGTFSAYLWGFTKGEIIYETGLAASPLSDTISKDLRMRGMKFVGSTVVYAYLQAVGVIFAHDDGCFLSREGERASKRN
jgi:DNA-3-methyladenine glycosylase I